MTRSDWLIIGIYSFLLWNLQFWGEWLEEDWSFWSKDTRYLLINISLVEVLRQVLTVIAIVFFIVPRYFYRKRYALSIALIIGILAFMRLIEPYILPYTSEPHYPEFFPKLLFGIMNGGEAIAFPSFLLLARSYYQSQRDMLALQKEQKETQLKVLQAQVDPHFLFNSLNILDILIPVNPEKAQQFTKKLAALYRYMIRHKDEDVVSLLDEWEFCKDYLFLIKQRFNGLFPVSTELNERELDQYFIPPAAMQTLLENITKHNVALPDKPVEITIELESDYIVIRNDYQPKAGMEESTGTGLQNLASRIALLTDRELQQEIEDGKFVVKVPLVKASSL